MLNVKKTLTKMLSLTPTFEYVGDASAIHWSSWTAADDGQIVADIGWDTSRGFGYYYINDITANRPVGKVLTTDTNGTSSTACFPVIKGHTYKVAGWERVNGAGLHFYFYKIKLGGGN